MNYYDLVLGLIPVSLLAIAGLLSLAGFGLTTAVPIGAAVSAGLIGHAMFVRGPVDSGPAEQASASRPRFDTAD